MIREFLINITELNTQQIFNEISVNTSLKISKLHSYYNYSISVTAVTVSPGPYSDPITFITSEDSKFIFLCNYYISILCNLVTPSLYTHIIIQYYS